MHRDRAKMHFTKKQSKPTFLSWCVACTSLKMEEVWACHQQRNSSLHSSHFMNWKIQYKALLPAHYVRNSGLLVESVNLEMWCNFFFKITIFLLEKWEER